MPIDTHINSGRTYLPPLTTASQKKLARGDQHWEPERGQAMVGQVGVKEGWHYREISKDEYQREVEGRQPDPHQTRWVPSRSTESWRASDAGKQILPIAVRYAEKEVEQCYYRADGLAGLFIMTKLDPHTPGTDAGWIYGTVDADLKTVTEVGSIANCVK